MTGKGFKMMEESIREKGEKVWKKICGSIYFQVFFFCLVTFFEFVILELFFDVSAFSYTPVLILKNVLLLAMVNLFLVGIFHSLRLPLMISVVFFLVVGIANYFVTEFRGYGIVFMDFYAVKTAAGVAGGYKYHVSTVFVSACALDLALLASCFVLPKRKHAYRNIKYTFVSLGGMAVSVLFCFWISSDTIFFKDVSSLTWDHNIGMKNYGYVLYFTSNAGKATVSKPNDYSVKKVDQVLSHYEKQSDDIGKKQSDVKNPNLIMIMNESYADLSVLGNIQTDQEVMPFYKSLKKNVIKGYAESSVYGGYTANSEFEFLTGCTKAFLPGNPYLQYIDGYLPTMINTIKKQTAYKEAIAMHPYHPSGYNRNRVYPLLGFDRFLSLDDFDQSHLVRDYVGDKEDYRKIEELYEKKEKGTSLCVFNVTMQNHNAYDDRTYQFENPVRVTNFSASFAVNQYLSLIKMSDDALKELVTYFEKVDEPTMIVLFGDHQPHLDDLFYKTVMGTLPSLFTQQQVMKEHMVPFMIWTNYDIEEKEIDHISLNYLSSLVLQTANIPMSDYNRYLLALSKKLPSISASGYYDAKGALHEYSDSDTTYKKLLDEYEMVQYHYLFDEKNRLKKHF